MTKLQFLLSLHKKLSAYPKNEVEERLRFYSEMIEDRMEEGLSEEESVAAVGSVDEISAQVALDLLPAKKEKQNRQTKAWQIVFLALGSPVWFSLLIAVFAVILCLYISAWAVLLSLWAVFVSLIACVFGGIVLGIGLALGGKTLPGVALIAAGILCVGLAIFLFIGCKAATTGMLVLTKRLTLWFKKRFLKKEEV